jgi:uncharacterized protein with NAD-binding domain and iron-sulfur cluster
MAARRVVIVGGGVASLVAGIELRESLPRCEVEILTDVEPARLGGQVGSWDERGYPIEHGLHALFGFYDQILPLLERIGALANFTRSPSSINVHERGGVQRFRPRSWVLTYRGMSLRERLGLARCLPPLRRRFHDVLSGPLPALDDYDRYDLREFLRAQGVPPSVLESDFVRSLYDGPFSHPHQMSAALGLQSLYRIFARPWHYHFNYPARDALVEPLRRHFVDACGGRVRYRTRLERLHRDPRDGRVRALEVRAADGRTQRVDGDAFVIALGLESFKRLDLGALWELPYFDQVRRLESVSSLSLQAWFREEPSPRAIDTLLVGLPEPLSILSPTSRVRGVPPPRRRLPFEIIATGAEGDFAGVDDETIARDFFATLRGLGFRIPQRWTLGREERDAYVILRRNRSGEDRYLLSRPGTLRLRPPVQSPVPNLMVAGAWTRNSLALPCVNSAAESGRTAARAILAGFERESAAAEAVPFRGMPRGHPLVLPPPYDYRRVRGALFLVRTDRDRLAGALPGPLAPAPGFAGRLLLAVLDNAEVTCRQDPSRSLYRYHEVVLAAVVSPRQGGPAKVGLFPLVVYVDDDAALAVGREVYGFPKKMAAVEIGDGRARMVRNGRPAGGAGEGHVAPLELLDLAWRTRPGPQIQNRFARAALRRVLELGFFNELSLPAPAGAVSSAAPSVLTWVQASGVTVRGLTLLHRARLRVGDSSVDPLRGLLGPEPRVSSGIGVDFAFTIGAGETLERGSRAASAA